MATITATVNLHYRWLVKSTPFLQLGILYHNAAHGLDRCLTIATPRYAFRIGYSRLRGFYAAPAARLKSVTQRG